MEQIKNVFVVNGIVTVSGDLDSLTTVFMLTYVCICACMC